MRETTLERVGDGSDREQARLGEGERVASDVEVEALARAIGLRLAASVTATTADEAVAASHELGWPVVMKLADVAIAHRSDVGGVVLGLYDERGVREAFDRLCTVSAKNPQSRVSQVVVQAMERPGVELILAARVDTGFGRIVVLGLGGVMVEQMQEAAFRLVPVTEHDVVSMLDEWDGRKLLAGYRGMPSVEAAVVADVVVRLSNEVGRQRRIREVEFNPVVVTDSGLVAVDWRMLVASREE